MTVRDRPRAGDFKEGDIYRVHGDIVRVGRKKDSGNQEYKLCHHNSDRTLNNDPRYSFTPAQTEVDPIDEHADQGKRDLADHKYGRCGGDWITHEDSRINPDI